MAVKKKPAKKSAPKKAAPKRPKRAKVASARARKVPVPIEAPVHAQGSRASLLPFFVIAGLMVALYFAFKKEGPIPPAHKVAAGVQVEPQPAPTTPSTAPTPPQKRSTSPAGPRVWDRKKSKGLVHFFVMRDKGGVAEVQIFKAGNVSVRHLASEKGGRQTVELKWDGLDASGKAVSAGTYYARISGAHGDSVEEISVK